ncbi:hypothetical protein D9M68_342740 [compost metagenome]
MLKLFSRKRNRDEFIERTHRDMPGFSHPSVDDLRFQVVQFEKLVKDYIQSKNGSLPSKNLHQLVNHELKKYPLHTKFPEIWERFLIEASDLKEHRNKILHSDFEDYTPNVPELFERFSRANETLYPFRICSANRDRFKPVKWHKNSLELYIDDNRYILEPADLNNLMIELHPASRGKVHFIKGRLVTGKVLDYRYEKITYFIEDYPEFALTDDESATLEDLLSSLIGQHAYG